MSCHRRFTLLVGAKIDLCRLMSSNISTAMNVSYIYTQQASHLYTKSLKLTGADNWVTYAKHVLCYRLHKISQEQRTHYN